MYLYFMSERKSDGTWTHRVIIIPIFALVFILVLRVESGHHSKENKEKNISDKEPTEDFTYFKNNSNAMENFVDRCF